MTTNDLQLPGLDFWVRVAGGGTEPRPLRWFPPPPTQFALRVWYS